ncbi:hypothetical protein K9M59_00130 [Candidatus Gracilibacteria bacterium]|nr:hypothetical protein [Candidatus Gracilibacteria bacterium]MCF7818993.1 hypothetical protein [Candidatus Gracilibacteria bacterium]
MQKFLARPVSGLSILDIEKVDRAHQKEHKNEDLRPYLKGIAHQDCNAQNTGIN